MKNRVLAAVILCGGIAIAAAVVPVVLWNNPWALALGIFCAFCVLCLLASFEAQRISNILKNIDPDEVDADECYSELKPILRKIVRQEALISSQLSQLKQRQKELFSITENMAEGLIVADKKGEIMVANGHARRMLLNGGDGVTVFDFSDEPNFVAAVRSALSGTVAQADMVMPGKIYRVYANPLMTDDKPSGAVVLILDKTEEQLREEMRREFTSNVSHELKTPLTSIHGISEILVEGIVKPEDVHGFCKSIFDESGRLITLVNDVIKLSQMDENCVLEEKDPVDLAEIVKSVCDRLGQVAVKKKVLLNVDCEEATVLGIYSILEEMIYNLTDNAIKYNKAGGSVRVSTEKNGSKVTVTVADTGIGISNEHIGRIFERFYRVDKSHSKQVGGTGLGLSIVKHGASFHGAQIEVQSTPDKGTVIKLIFAAYAEEDK